MGFWSEIARLEMAHDVRPQVAEEWPKREEEDEEEEDEKEEEKENEKENEKELHLLCENI